MKLGKIQAADFIAQKVEILCVLKKLGENLSGEEEDYLNTNMNANLKQFEVASTNISN